MTGPALRIASYNTRDFLDDRLAAARVIRAISPDVLCLQEVPRRLFAGGRVRRFARECGMRWPGGHRGSGGTTIFLSERLTWEVAWHRRLAVAVFLRTRGYAAVRLITPAGRPLVVASVHLSLRAGERHAHARDILTSVGDLAGDDGAVVVAGDLNEHESGLAWQLLASRLTRVSPADPTFPTRRPRVLLDVIFATPDVPVLPHADVALAESDLLAASDHRPVWVDLLV